MMVSDGSLKTLKILSTINSVLFNPTLQKYESDYFFKFWNALNSNCSFA